MATKRMRPAYQVRKARGYRAAVSRKLGPKADTDEMVPDEREYRIQLYAVREGKGKVLCPRRSDTRPGDDE